MWKKVMEKLKHFFWKFMLTIIFYIHKFILLYPTDLYTDKMQVLCLRQRSPGSQRFWDFQIWKPFFFHVRKTTGVTMKLHFPEIFLLSLSVFITKGAAEHNNVTLTFDVDSFSLRIPSLLFYSHCRGSPNFNTRDTWGITFLIESLVFFHGLKKNELIILGLYVNS